MRALVQRVSEASVRVNDCVIGAISLGLLVFLGVKEGDTPALAVKLAGKVTRLRVFPDEAGKMNKSLVEIHGGLLIVSQFTLYGDTSGGNRPSYARAAKPELAQELYELFVSSCRVTGLHVATGVFREYMRVQLVNDGPVTLICDSGE